LAPDTGELLGPSPDRLIPGEVGHY